LRIRYESDVGGHLGGTWNLLTRGDRWRRSRFEHPGLKHQALQPILDGGNPAQVFFHVLFAQKPGGNHAALAIRDRRTENPFRQKNALGVMSKRAMTDVRKERFRFIELIVQLLIVFRFAAVFIRAG
jgi:hypothetical protein